MKSKAELEAEKAKALVAEAHELVSILKALDVRTKMILIACGGD